MKSFLPVYILSGFLLALIIAGLWVGLRYYSKDDELITLEATFMQYACGDGNDDMKVLTTANPKFKFLLGTDIDPQVGLFPDTYELLEYFYKNRSKQYNLTYRIKGRLSKYPHFGCSDTARKFWVEEIEKMDGTGKMTKDAFSVKWLAN